jgi:hypothetical protein
MKTPSLWRTTPIKSRVIFLLAVFFVFVGIGLTNDVIGMGRQHVARIAASVALSGLFAVVYAATGVALRGKFWKAAVPLFVVQFFTMVLLANLFPDSPQAVQMNEAQTAHLRTRMTFVGFGIIVSVVLGYVGFVYVSISEGRRHIRAQAEKATLEAEMAAAREVQRMMVPEDLPFIAGYKVETIYRPAAEVGGDFYQVIPLKSGGHTLIVIGDVSGKGLRAAMIVSMIVGMLSIVSSSTDEPAEILAELNRRLCGRAHGGFATCVVVRLDADGQLVLANAGHPPPYLNRTEIPFAGSIPLGLVETASYTQTTLDMRAGDRALLLTDGVAEARNAQGALFGFSGVESLLREGASARTVAEAAQQHGQNDDLTVISIARTA